MTRIEKVIEGMRQMNLEQFLVTDPMAVYYLTGQYYACGERMMVLRLDVEKDPVLVIGKLFPQDEEKLGIKVVYFDDTDDCVEVLASHMRKGGTIGIDKTWSARPDGTSGGRCLYQCIHDHRPYPSDKNSRRAGKNACGFPL